MATVARSPALDRPFDRLVGTPRAHALDRWIFVATAAWYIVIVLTGFIPDSLMKMELVRTGQRPPFPLVLHFHAVFMGAFLLFLLAQSLLVATGRTHLHRRIGPAGGVLAAALIVVGFVLVPTIYYQVWDGLQAATPQTRPAFETQLAHRDNILLAQLRIGIVFTILFAIGLRARVRQSGLHKRMMFIATASAIPPAFARMTWFPTTMPADPLSSHFTPLIALAPLFVWDVIRNHRVHGAWFISLAVYVPVAFAVQFLWDTPWWHATVHRMMGV